MARPRRSKTQNDRSLDLLRLLLLLRSEQWAVGEGHGLTPAQLELLVYLAHANEFSRSPAAIAEFCGTTRGTISQTLKLLEQKGLVERLPDPYDGRSLRVNLTPSGRKLVTGPRGHERVLERMARFMSDRDLAALDSGTRGAVRALVQHGDYRAFGTCNDCQHFQARRGGGGSCEVLGVDRIPSRMNESCQYATPRS